MEAELVLAAAEVGEEGAGEGRLAPAAGYHAVAAASDAAVARHRRHGSRPRRGVRHLCKYIARENKI